MPRYLVLVFFIFSIACKNEQAASADMEPVNAAGLFDAFNQLALPFAVADTSLARAADTTTIGYEVFTQYVPDSALLPVAGKKPGSLTIHPVGKIEKEDEIYLLATVTDGKKTSLLTYLFDKNKKYLNNLLLLNSRGGDNYVRSVHINTEPTFLLVQEKTENNQYHYSKTGYAYSGENESFVEVINDSNEDEAKNKEIQNPIDTFAATNTHSGNYTVNKKNFIAIRDGSSAGSYLFFIHFEKGSGSNMCKGELKGTLKMVAENKAVFEQSGDPCVIDFTFKGNAVVVKERGKCGNHRGMTCLFDDSYKKKAIAAPKGKKKQ